MAQLRGLLKPHAQPRARTKAVALGLFTFLLVAGCSSTSGGGGCGGLQPIPTGRYTGPKTSNAVSIRLSANGFNYLNSNWQTLLSQFAPGGTITVPVPCQVIDVPVAGQVVAVDQGKAGCTGESCGLMDGKCCLTGTQTGCTSSIVDLPKTITVNLTSFALQPISPDKLQGTIGLSINTGKIYLATASDSAGVCFGFSRLKCSVDYVTSRGSTAQQAIAAQVKFTIDTRWDELMSFSITSLQGTQICGASGAPAKPRCLDPDDININGENNCGVWCDGADLSFVKEFVLKQISPTLQGKIIDMIKAQSCASCKNGEPCPTLPNASSSCNASDICIDSGGGSGTCSSGKCTNNQSICTSNAHCARCAPRFLGIEGRVSPGALLGNFGVPASSLLDLSVAAGGNVAVNTGINLGTRAGLKAVAVADCVPAVAAPLAETVPAPNFDSVTSSKVSGYHVGLGLSRPFLNMAMYEAHQSGALCINLSSATVGVLNTGLFKTFLPSLGRLATRDGKDAPMMIVLRPAKAPVIKVGEGTYDPVTKKPVKPLLVLTLPELTIDFYAMLDDRFARLFSLTADISLPLSLIFEGCSSVTPAIGDLKQLVTNISTSNSEILAEDPKVLADLIPAVVGLAEPAVASALKPFTLPSIAGFKMQVMDATGVGPLVGTDYYNHLGIYAKLLSPTAQCATSAPVTKAFLKKTLVPTREQLQLRGEPLPWPTVLLDVQALGAPGTAEFAYRVGDGMWTTFQAAANGELEVSHPSFLLQGQHRIEVRSRMAEEPYGISAPDVVGVTFDFEPPEVSLSVDRAAGRIDVTARDVVTAPERLEYAYRVGEGAVSDFGPARIIDLEAVEAQGGVEVHVRDEAGLIGVAAHRAPLVQERGPNPVEIADGTDAPAGGCSSAGGLLAALSILSAALLRRRR